MPNKENSNPNTEARQAHEVDMLEASLGQSEQKAADARALAVEVSDLVNPSGNYKATITAEAREPLDPNAGPLKLYALLRDAGASVELDEAEAQKPLSILMLSDAELGLSQETEALDGLRGDISAILDSLEGNEISVMTSTGEIFKVRYDYMGDGKKLEDVPVEDRPVSMIRGVGLKWDEKHGPEPKDIGLYPGKFGAYIPNENIAAPLNSPANPRNWDDNGMYHFLETEIIPGMESALGDAS